MFENWLQFLPAEGVKILIVLFLSFLIGLEREEHKAESEHYSFGGVRTFPLIGLVGYVMALISGGQLLPLSIGFAVVGGFLLVSYRHKLASRAVSDVPGVTTEISGLATYLLGALVSQGYFWIATTLTVASLLLLELKEVLEGLSKRLAPEEVLTFTKFLLLTAVILPVLPNTEFTQFRINPFKTWLVVVAVSGISYGSYVLLRVTKQRSSVILSAILGGAYSSTATTVALAKKSAHEQHPYLFAGGILVASGVMYLRLAVLLALFNRNLFAALAVPLVILACLAGLAGWLWSRLRGRVAGGAKREFQPKNPLELRAAILFAVLFLAVMAVTRFALEHLGHGGIYGLASLIGFMDVDPFVLGMTQSAGTLTPVSSAAISILVAAASNNVAKGIYAYAFADRKTGIQGLGLLMGLAVLGLTPLWMFR
ncbi:MAG TPA: MgtC/SapB family protein [Terriglobales bacterium]|jgi:uncharacterized membrane protein (DUF4010 family)|nr:MgtC/SapB family protein [Terriglobales bacterium]